MLGIAHGDVAGDPFVEAEAREQAERSGEALASMKALLGLRLKSRRLKRQLESEVSWVHAELIRAMHVV
jgi:hypothetical protein